MSNDSNSNKKISDKSKEELNNEMVQSEEDNKIKKPDNQLLKEELLDNQKNIIFEASKKQKKLIFFGEFSNFWLNLSLILAAILLFLFLIANRGKTNSWTAPWYIWITNIVSLVLSIIIYKNYSTKYIVNINNNKLIKEVKFLNYLKNYNITDYNKINLLGVSTEFYCERYADDKTGEKCFSSVYKAIAFYDSDNKQILLESDHILNTDNDLQNINSRVEAAAKIIGCEYIPCDASSRIELTQGSPDMSIKSLITLIPKDKQCSRLNEKDENQRTKYLFIVIMLVIATTLISAIVFAIQNA